MKMLVKNLRWRVGEIGRSHWVLMDEAGLSRDAIRSIYDGRDAKWTSVSNILTALGLELYVGPYRDLDNEMLSPEALRSASEFERVASGALPEGKALAQLVEIHLKLLRRRRRKSR